MVPVRPALLRIVTPLLALGAACSSLRSAPHPLYPPPVVAPDQVATLSGPVATVDGIEVPSKPSFALLPGCHVVVLQKRIGEGTQGGAWSVDLRHTAYVFQMKAGHIYDIEVHLQPGGTQSVGSGNVGGIKITAVERDAKGHAVGTLAPVRSRAEEAQGCQAAAEPAAP